MQQGHGQVVSLVGEPGIGKSRLLREFQHQMRDQTLTWGVGRCISYGSAMPYTPVTSLLCDLCEIPPAASVTEVASRLQHHLDAVASKIMSVYDCQPNGRHGQSPFFLIWRGEYKGFNSGMG